MGLYFIKKYHNLEELLKDYRSYRGISQSQLASHLDVDVRTVIRWEKSKSLLNPEKEKALPGITFIPYQVIPNLNTPNQISTFFDFDLRKYSLSHIASKLPDADWIKSRMDVSTKRLKNIESKAPIEDVIRFTELQKTL